MCFSDLRHHAWMSFFSLLLTSACGSLAVDPDVDDDRADPEITGVVSEAFVPHGGTQTPHTDAQIGGIFKAMAAAEIAESQYAVSVTKNAKVSTFAKKTVDDYTKAMSDLASLLQTNHIIAVSNTYGGLLASMTTAQTQALHGMTGADFDRTYVMYQQETCHMLLNVLDAQLIPEAHNQPLRTLLTQIRGTVAQHLTLAATLGYYVGH